MAQPPPLPPAPGDASARIEAVAKTIASSSSRRVMMLVGCCFQSWRGALEKSDGRSDAQQNEDLFALWVGRGGKQL